MPEPRKPRLTQDRDTGRWQARCVPCRLTLSADYWAEALAALGRHLSTKSHREAAVLDALAHLDTTGGTR